MDMAVKAKIKSMAEDVTLNKNVGTFSYWVHRLTGIGLSIYLLMHTFVLSSAISGGESFNERMGLVQNPLFAVLELFLVAGIFFHMLNGIRITLADFFGWSRSHKSLFWAVIVIFVILMIIAVILQVPKFDAENYAMRGGV
jgi:succinate dehydrogenase / fumarate reductase cytochrome b subunit